MPHLQLIGGVLPPVTDPKRSYPHVVLLLDGFPKALGGGERIVLRLASLLPSYGYRVTIVALQMHPETELVLENASCPVYLLPLTSAYGLNALRGAWELGRFLRRENVRLVQTFFESSDLWGGLVTKALSPAKLVWSRRDMGILRTPKHQRAYRALRRLPDAVSAVSLKVAQHSITADGVPSDRVHVVHNGLDLIETRPRSEDRRSTARIATVGNIRHVKGHDVLIEAIAQVRNRGYDVEVAIAGAVLESAYFEQMQTRIRDLEIESHVQFAGKITDLQGFLSTADYFVLPSRSEGFSNALVEAMAAGLAVIATDVGGNGEAIQNKKNGLLVPPDDASAIADALCYLLDDAETAVTFRAAAQRTVREDFTAEAMMRKTVRLYDLLLPRSPRENGE